MTRSIGCRSITEENGKVCVQYVTIQSLCVTQKLSLMTDQVRMKVVLCLVLFGSATLPYHAVQDSEVRKQLCLFDCVASKMDRVRMLHFE